MTIEPISDERLAEIRAGLEGVTLKEAAHAAHAAFQAIIRREHPYLPPVRPLSEEKQYLQDAYEEMVKEAAAVYAPALLSRLDKAEAGEPDEARIAAARERAEALGPGMPGIMRMAFADIAENAIRQYFRPLPPPPSSES